MESSFKKGYDKKVNADGSFELSLSGQKRGAAQTAGYPITYAGVGVLSIMLAFTVANKIKFGNVAVYLLTAGLMAFGTWFAFYSWFKSWNTKNTSILIKPKEGLVFEGKNLPFTDIQSVGKTHQTTSSNLDGNAQVYAVSHGVEIALTGWMTVALAESVVREIKQSSGITWH